MDLLRSLLSCCYWKKPSRYGYTVIRGRRDDNYTENSQISLQSFLSVNRPISEEDLENLYDSQDEIIASFKNLQTSRILLEIPSLGRRLTNQLADFLFSDDDQVYVGNEREEILKQNLLYLASCTENVEQLGQELLQRKVLRVVDVEAIEAHNSNILKALEILKLVLNQRDSLGFLIGALKTTGSNFVADIFIGNYYPLDSSELICKISLTPEFSPEFILKGSILKYKVLRKISKERQDVLRVVNCSFIEFKGKTLLNSIEHCKNLDSLKLTDVRLKKGFPRKISLPSLKRFVLHINKNFVTKKDFFDDTTPQKILNLLFFIKDENNNVHNSLFFGTLNSRTNGPDDHQWNIKDIWDLNINIFIKVGGRTVLLIDHVKSRLFSRVENYYKIPENVIQPNEVRNLCLGWINKIAKSSIPLNLTKLTLCSIDSIDSKKNEINIILKNSSHLREFKFWNQITAQPWPILKYSCLPPRLRILAASFIEIQMDDHSPCRLDHISLFFYKIRRDEENEKNFLSAVGRCKSVCFAAFPPHEQPNEEQLFTLMESGRLRQILVSGCQHSFNLNHHYLHFRQDVVESLQNTNSFILHKNDDGWTGRQIEKSEFTKHLYTKFGFEVLYSYEVFLQHEIISNLWKFFK